MEQLALWRLYESGDIRAAIPLMMICTGLMPGECQNIRVENIKLDEHKIVGVGIKTKVRKESPVFLPNDILPIVEDLIANAQPSGYLWPRSTDKWYADYYAALEAAGERHRRKQHFHREGVPVRLTADRLQRHLHACAVEALIPNQHGQSGDDHAAQADPQPGVLHMMIGKMLGFMEKLAHENAQKGNGDGQQQNFPEIAELQLQNPVQRENLRMDP